MVYGVVPRDEDHEGGFLFRKILICCLLLVILHCTIVMASIFYGSFSYELLIGKKVLWGWEHKYNPFSIMLLGILYRLFYRYIWPAISQVIFLYIKAISGCTIEYPSV